MEFPTIDMSRFVKTGAGANGESYDSLDDQDMMLKLYNADYPVQPVIDELEIAKKVYAIGVPSPQPGELVKVGDRLGIKFRRIRGKRSYSRALADEPERVVEFAREFAEDCRLLHGTVCPEGVFPSQKEQYLKLLEADREFSPEEQAKLKAIIDSMPDSQTAVHGDLHIGNILTTLPAGKPMSDSHEIYFIDLGYFAHGCPLLDLGMLQNICLYAGEDFRKAEMHVTGEVTRKFWDAFVEAYFFGEDRLADKWFGAGKTPADIDPLLRPYMCVKMLLVEFNLGFMPQDYAAIIRATI